jgi:hypothetical protein
MFRRTYHVATINRWIALACSVTLGACAARGADRPQVTVMPALAPDVATKAREAFIVDTEEFALVASSARAKELSLEALRSAASTFVWLFGDPAPHIGVVVVDGRSMASSAPPPMMPEDQTTIMVMAGDLSGSDAPEAARELSAALHIMSADAWIHDYADEWTPAASLGEAEGGEAVENIPRAESLPHWLRVGTLRTLAEGKLQRSNVDVLGQSLLPMGDLLTYRLRPEQVTLVGKMLHRTPSGTGRSDASADDSVDMRFARGFMLQSASVLRYLRETEGDAATSDLFGASMNGMPVDAILASLPHAMTMADLDRDWRSWVAQRSASAVAPAVR